jgi:hypothetical protein
MWQDPCEHRCQKREPRESMKSSTRENIGIVIALVLTVVLVTVTDRLGMPQKWHAAIVGTLTSFCVVVLSYRLRWSRWSFWTALGVCLTIHSIAIWIEGLSRAGFSEAGPGVDSCLATGGACESADSGAEARCAAASRNCCNGLGARCRRATSGRERRTSD